MGGGNALSRNKITVDQISLACRHVRELMDAGVTENLAIRILEHFVDVYAKLLNGGSATPHHVSQVPVEQWSVAARQLWKRQRGRKPKDYLRVEHGTPKRALARMVLKLHESDELSSLSLNNVVRHAWKLAVITLEEDTKLNRLARSKAYETPDERWKSVGIEFQHKKVSKQIETSCKIT